MHSKYIPLIEENSMGFKFWRDQKMTFRKLLTVQIYRMEVFSKFLISRKFSSQKNHGSQH